MYTCESSRMRGGGLKVVAGCNWGDEGREKDGSLGNVFIYATVSKHDQYKISLWMFRFSLQ